MESPKCSFASCEHEDVGTAQIVSLSLSESVWGQVGRSNRAIVSVFRGADIDTSIIVVALRPVPPIRVDYQVEVAGMNKRIYVYVHM